MANPVDTRMPQTLLSDDLPILYEDDKEADLGESNIHVDNDEILHICLKSHLAGHAEYRVFSNMNLYYQEVESQEVSPLPYVSPDTMVVKPTRPLGEVVRSYQIGRDGPPPLLTAEILSERSAEQRDLDEKVTLYAKLGVAEYILVDVTGQLLPQRLLLKRLQPDGTWQDEQDPDGGVTSQLGFRLIIDNDGKLRVLEAITGKRYARPDEAEMEAEAHRRAEEAREQAEERLQVEAEARRQAEERIRALEAELRRLRGTPPDSESP
jgi:Uma2 family endonuclease